MSDSTIKLIVHGGAWSIPDEQVDAHVRGVHQAVEQVMPHLQAGCSALDAVEAAVAILEADPTFDAGRGAFLNAKGQIELDAIIADGSKLDFGAVAGIPNLLHPVKLARLVLEETEHCFLIGEGAIEFARSKGMETVAPETLLTDRELAFFEEIKSNPDFRSHHPFEPSPSDTVGAVAMDQNGNLAAATSTGGTPRKLPGRVGDSPIFGAGAYADNGLGAASATGWGEAILRTLLTKYCCDLFDHFSDWSTGKGEKEAIQQSLDYLQKRTNGHGGLIGISRKGNYAFGHNTERMAHAYFEEGRVISDIKVHKGLFSFNKE
ncbi:MAG: isoaspartyl peptidase/L-asparaginase [Bacteroidota bacterium]